MIQKYHTNYEVGIYAQANKLANLMWIIPNIIALLLMPRFFKANRFEFEFYLRILFVLNLFITCATVFLSYFIYHFYLPAEYLKGQPSFFLMLPGYFFWSIVIYFGAYYSAIGQFTKNLYGSTICLFIILISDLFLIPSFGIKGAAIANTL